MIIHTSLPPRAGFVRQHEDIASSFFQPFFDLLRLSDDQELHVLDHLHANDDWKQHGIVVGEPVAYLSLENPEEESERVVTDQFDLDAGQTQELLDLIERDEKVLQHLAGRSA